MRHRDTAALCMDGTPREHRRGAGAGNRGQRELHIEKRQVALETKLSIASSAAETV
jgi:hypothetical protein